MRLLNKDFNMSLIKKVSIDKIEVLENDLIQVREITRIIENDIVLSSSYNRWVLSPESDLSNQDPKVVAVANAVWSKDKD